ncbi:MAG: MbnP family protein [Bacteroidota bacterium]
MTYAIRTLLTRGPRLAALALAGAFVLAGCEANDPTEDFAQVRLDLEPLFDGAALQGGEALQIQGRTGVLETARLYLSDLTLIQDDGTEVLIDGESITVRARDEDDAEVQHTITERYVYAASDRGRTETMLGEVPAGSYRGLRFTLGVNGLDNRIAPEDAPSSHPLAPQTPSMHWNWNAGYVFLRLDGLLDVDGDGTVDDRDVDGDGENDPRDPASGFWRLHLGGAANAMPVEIDTPFTLEAGAAQDLHLQVDYARFLAGVDYDEPFNRFCMTGDCADVVQTVTANVADAFSLHGTHGDN